MLRRTLAVLFVILMVLPFTAPFPAFDLGGNPIAASSSATSPNVDVSSAPSLGCASGSSRNSTPT
jgi:hypothetical protein